ncbi:MAG TPA: Holliday junction branch migration protein RuvA [Desulfobacteraceae bacterium]|jgi:Holliday junction DNA helicase RuvA|nr:Holliday junction branch migration protein RuvA [Desulfobacteraceae bacterium]HPJ68973.1 Holliday junction branch migration protein RuvA [Desulfobacteraceae bacterium]HPQ29166.1 Holliday junction branch migration protein RuvA [Desulfobacteraceae bacterium]
MIAHLSGLLLSKTTQSVIIEAGGVGYEVYVPLSTYYKIPKEKEKLSLHIYTHVREDALILFGFKTRLEKDVFILLTSVSGIGPKLSVNILSGIGPFDLLKAISIGDSLKLQTIPGVGRKMADRIALELKDRALKVLSQEDREAPPQIEGKERLIVDDALSALLNLGYTQKSAREAIDKARSVTTDVTLEVLIREALKVLA